MKISSYSKAPGNSKAGFGLLQMMLLLVIMGIITVVAVPDMRNLIFVSKNAAAKQLETQLNDWYSSWTHAGGIHSTSGAPHTAAYRLMTVMTSPASSAGVKDDTDGFMINEQREKVGGISVAGTIRYEMRKEFVPLSSDVRVDGIFAVTFDTRGTKDKGIFTVSVVEE